MEFTLNQKMILSFALEGRIKELESRINDFKSSIESGYYLEINADMPTILKRTESNLAETIELYKEIEAELNE